VTYRYRLQIAYDGTDYVGWQVQPNGTTIQEMVQRAVSIAIGEEVGVTGSGRTDSGVHALAQVGHFTASRPLDTTPLLRSLNGLLPPDIRVDLVTLAPPDFHARYSATGKIYRYHLCPESVQPPFRRLYSLHYRRRIDRTLLQEAANRLIGTHDFTSFANSSEEGSAARDPVRTLRRIDLYEWEGELVAEFEANGFLYRMVRNLMGGILEVAAGRITPDELTAILEQRDRRTAPQGVAAHGLFLVEVKYPAESLCV
jgi:tRNA pseudouridine38-40 synthase